MTTAAGGPPPPNTPSDLALGFLTGGVIGASLAGFVSGCVLGRTPLIVLGLALPVGYGLVLFLASLPRRAREAAVVPSRALALIEALEAVGGEASDVPVRFELSVVPDDAPAFRVGIRQEINLVELPDYRPRGVVVVEYPPDRPWKARIVKRPTPEWERRAAGARLDSVPGPAMREEHGSGCAGGLLTVLGLLFGAGAVLLLFRTELFAAVEDGAGAPRPAVTSSFSSSSSATITVTSVTGTVALGPGQSMLDQGEPRKAVDSLMRDGEQRQALTVVVQDRQLTVVFDPAGGVPGAGSPSGGSPGAGFPGTGQGLGFDPRSLPYDRIPGLVEEARRTLGVKSPKSWQLTADGITGALTLRIVVTGDGGSATLEADGRGQVLRRSGG
ncbi:hypothetical protein ACIQWA_40530 [Kitasatospora sp. NPDC098652]|uniref:hypothetical protein n=1 Tax=Kitasatospora sp. NPDC098652 TaxID=3364095 RepID=UPI0037F29DAC